MTLTGYCLAVLLAMFAFAAGCRFTDAQYARLAQRIKRLRRDNVELRAVNERLRDALAGMAAGWTLDPADLAKLAPTLDAIADCDVVGEAERVIKEWGHK